MKLLILSIHRHDFYAILIVNTPSLEINHMEQTPGLQGAPPHQSPPCRTLIFSQHPTTSMFQPGMEPGARAAVEREALPSSTHSAWKWAVAHHTQSPACRCRGESGGPDSRDHPPADPVDCPPACASPTGKWATPRISLSPWWRSLLSAAQPNPGPTQ